MRNSVRLFLVVAVGSLIATALYFGLALSLSALLQRPGVPRTVQGIGVAITVLAPICIASWWIFRRLLAFYERRAARSASIAFGFFTPLPLAISLLLGPIIGGYTGNFLGLQSRWVAFSGTVMGIVVMIAFTTFVMSLSAVWIVRRIGGLHQAQ